MLTSNNVNRFNLFWKKNWFVEEENGKKVECVQEKYIINVEAQMK